MEIAIGWAILLLVGFYFVIVRPQRQQVAAHRALVADVAVGDEVITAGGVYGTIRALRDDVMDLEIANGVVIRVARAAIARPVVLPGEGALPDQMDDGAEGEDV